MDESTNEIPPGGAVWVGLIGVEDADDTETLPVAVVYSEENGKYRPVFHARGRWRQPSPDFGYDILTLWALSKTGPATSAT